MGLYGSTIKWTCDDEKAVMDEEVDPKDRIWIRVKRPKEGEKKGSTHCRHHHWEDIHQTRL